MGLVKTFPDNLESTMKIFLSLLYFFWVASNIHTQPAVITNQIYEAIFPGRNQVVLSNEYFRFDNLSGLGYKGIQIPKQISYSRPEYRIDHSIPFLYYKDQKRVLVLRDDKICICFSPIDIPGLDVPFFTGINIAEKPKHELSDANIRKSSSSLSERTRTYTPEYLGVVRLDFPWSEGVKGYGIGEWLAFGIGTRDDRTGRPIGIYLINGYISFTNPERYTNNGRIKKMTLTSLKTGKSKQFDVLDTPNPQFFPTEDLGGYQFKLTIDDVYPGEKYEDTCVSGILSLNVSWDGPVPMEADFIENSPLLK